MSKEIIYTTTKAKQVRLYISFIIVGIGIGLFVSHFADLWTMGSFLIMFGGYFMMGCDPRRITKIIVDQAGNKIN